MTTFTVRGVPEHGPGAAPPSLGAFGDVVRVQDVSAVRVGETRGAEAMALQVDDGDVVEVELEGGIRLWTSPERMEETLQAVGVRGVGGNLALAPTLEFGPRSRGLGGLVLRVLKAFKVDVATRTARALAEELEFKLEPNPGLYRWSQAEPAGRITRGSELRGGVPLLVFLHGTASNTIGSFGGLRDPRRAEVWTPLAELYRDNILALEHRTLSVSPIQNALDLVQVLPDNAVLHLVSHSRGGLIGELVYRAQMTPHAPLGPEVKQRFEKAGRADLDLPLLTELAREVVGRKIRVERFVRVACPAAGTTLASRRLDLYLSVMLNAIGLIPGLRGNPVYEFLQALVLGVIKTRADPREIPGLESMMPESPLIGFLNEPGLRKVDADLSVIAGDTQGTGILYRLMVLATDLFYRENHDLVVNTGSMVGGIGRSEKTARLFFDKGGTVSHFHYFSNEGTARKLLQALTQPDAPSSGFEPITATTAEGLKTRAPEAAPAGDRPAVILIPGFGGSELWAPRETPRAEPSPSGAGQGGEGEAGAAAPGADSAVRTEAAPAAPEWERIWIGLEALAGGGFARLDLARPDPAAVEARALVAEGYAALAAHLGASHEVIPFPYDWRLSLLDAAKRLAAVVAERLGRSSQPVRLLAHSTGGLVARAMIAQNPELWRRVTENKGRLVMLGTPGAGSHRVLRLLLGQEPLVHGLALVDRTHDRGALVNVLGGFPGVLELLPADPPEWFTPQAWAALRGAAEDPAHVAAPASGALAAARSLHALLAAAPVDPRTMLYVAGCAPATPIGHHVHALRDGRQAIRFEATARGDGWTPWSGLPPGVKPWYADAQHGELASWRPLFAAIGELLQRGETRLLPERPPEGVRGETFLLRPGEASFFPGEAELAGAALGYEPRRRSDEAREEPLKVRVVHGNLSFVRHPIAVGHYAGDTINGAERELDRTLGGRLSEKRQLQLYPGDLETAGIFLCEDPTLRGAIVVGLGDVGTLTGARLERSFMRAVLAYASSLAERHPCDGEPQVYGASLATLLIGSGRGGIPLEDTVRALLRGAVAAGRALRGSELGNRVRIDTLEIWELYEDLALQAVRLVRRLAGDGRYAVRLADDALVTWPGGRRRASFGAEVGWWDRMTVTEQEGELVFETPTGRARVERRAVVRQKGLIDRFVASVVGGVVDNPEIARTLFHLLLPNELKDFAPDRNNLILVLDGNTARFPWEFLRSGADDEEPLSVKRGLIRQFATREFRRQVITPVTESVLVIGNPPATGLPPLPGAEREARVVADLLGARRFQVTPLIGDGFDKVLPALYARPYRILHVAAHGVNGFLTAAQKRRARRCGRRPRGISGVVLGDGVFLTSGEVDQLPAVPEVVFINCCHVGAIDPADPLRRHPGRLAASLAEQLIRIGVRAVVAAGWAVEDGAAVTFAETFYGRMLAGDAFGDAVQAARRATYERHPGTNTWGAYQCYGDHGYVLERAGEAAYAPPPDLDFSCPSEVVIELGNLASDAGTASQFGVRALRRRLREMEGKIGGGWRGDPSVIAALALAHSKLWQVGGAIRYYRGLARMDSARYPVEALEQLANLQSRWTVRVWNRVRGGAAPLDPKHLDRLMKRIAATVADLQALPGGATMSSERWALIGSAHKRLSQLEPTVARRVKRLAQMRDSYHTAHEVALQRGGRVDPYPTRNWLAARVVAQYLGAGIKDPAFTAWRQGEFDHWMRKADEATAVKEVRQPDFWSGAARTDGELIRYLADGTLAHHVDDIVKGYRLAWSRGGPELSLRSVVENLEWVIDCLTPPPSIGGIRPGPAVPGRAPSTGSAAAAGGAADAGAGPPGEARGDEGMLPSAHGGDPSAAAGEAPQAPASGEAGEGGGPAPASLAPASPAPGEPRTPGADSADAVPLSAPGASGEEELDRIVEALMVIRGRVMDFLNEPGASQAAGR